MMFRLTSPNMVDPAIGPIQKLLKDKGYYSLKVDNIYGEKTALGVKSAKWDLGYAEKDITSECDDTFVMYLSGKKKPTLVMKQRIKARTKQKSLGEKAVIVGTQFIGTSEFPPGSNKVIFSNWYGMNGPWCAMFVTYCFTQAGSKAFVKGKKYAYCPYILSDAKYHRNDLRLVSAKDAMPGDVVLFDWDKDGIADHVGMVVVAPENGKSFRTLEGNTSGTNPSDGGMVASMTRKTSDVIGFVRVLN